MVSKSQCFSQHIAPHYLPHHRTNIPRFSMLSRIQNTCVVSISTAVATDLLTSVFLIHYFRRSRTAFSKYGLFSQHPTQSFTVSRTNSALDLLINYALGTGLVQS
jgi:hypothetical protein